MKSSGLSTNGTRGSDEARQYSANREVIGHKYAALREQTHEASTSESAETSIASAKVSLLDEVDNSLSSNTIGRTTSGLSMTWQSMKMGLHNLKENIGTKKLIPSRQGQETKLQPNTSSESLDEIFQRLKRGPTSDHATYSDSEDDDDTESNNVGRIR